MEDTQTKKAISKQTKLILALQAAMLAVIIKQISEPVNTDSPSMWASEKYAEKNKVGEDLRTIAKSGLEASLIAAALIALNSYELGEKTAEKTVKTAYRNAQRQATRDLIAKGHRTKVPKKVTPQAEAHMREAEMIVRGLRGGMVTQGTTLYSRTVTRISDLTVSHRELSIEQATKLILSDLRNSPKGIGGFVDKAGRKWKDEAYLKMALQAIASNAHREGLVSTYVDNDERYVVVGSCKKNGFGGHPCKKCVPWVGRVIDLTGDGTGADATYAQAKDSPLFHPYCDHDLSLP